MTQQRELYNSLIEKYIDNEGNNSYDDYVKDLMVHKEKMEKLPLEIQDFLARCLKTEIENQKEDLARIYSYILLYRYYPQMQNASLAYIINSECMSLDEDYFDLLDHKDAEYIYMTESSKLLDFDNLKLDDDRLYPENILSNWRKCLRDYSIDTAISSDGNVPMKEYVMYF
jgi:hypothetical protein